MLRSCRRSFLLLAAIVCLSSVQFSWGQETPPPASNKASGSARTLVQLTIHDFSLAETVEQSTYYSALQKAIPDALYLYFLSNPRLQVSRDPTVFRSKADVSPESSVLPGNQQSPESLYMLAGKITPVGVRSDSEQGSQLAGHRLFILQYQIWEQANPHDDPKQKGAPGSLATTTSELLDNLNLVAQAVVDILVPTQKLTLSLAPVQVDGFPDQTRRFYEANLLGLLRSSLLQSGLVQLTDTAQSGAYKLTESAHVRGDRCDVRANLVRPDGKVVDVPPEEGPKERILDTQARSTQNLIDALRIENGSALPGEVPSVSASASEYIESGNRYQGVDPELAVALYRKALALDASNTTARQSLANNLLNLDRPKEVVDVLNNPKDSRDHLLLALAYWKLKENERTVAELKAGLKLAPKDPQYYERAATLFEDLGDYDGAATTLDTGRRTIGDKKLSTLTNEVRRRGAAALINNGKPEQALPLALAALKEEPQSEWGNRLAGIAYLQMKDKDQARGEKYLKKAIDINPTAYAATELGILRLEQKRYEEAQKLGQQAIELDSGYSGGYSVIVDEIEDRAKLDPHQARVDAGEAVSWLKQFWNQKPSALTAVATLSQIQIVYVGTSPQEMHELYLIDERAVQGIPYAEWLPGWTNLVEQAMLDGHFEEAARVANELLKIELPPRYRVNVAFYSWLEYLLLGDCEKFQAYLSGFVDYVRRPELQGFQNPWLFDGTRRFIAVQSRDGSLTKQATDLIDSALTLLEITSFTQEAVQKFASDSSRFSMGACANRMAAGH